MRNVSLSYQISLSLLSFSIFILSIYPLVSNYKYSDNSKNWICYDLGKNILSCVEEYSILMTEGADNHVFPILYFTQVEGLRPDVFPYDQMGNVFKKIYGDLRWLHMQKVQERQPIINRKLLEGEEPFYKNLKDTNLEPYFIPYPHGKPSVYMTWKMSSLEKLGYYYPDPRGQIFKIRNIKDFIIDYLTNKTNASISEIQTAIETELKYKISSTVVKQMVDELNSDNIISYESKIQLLNPHKTALFLDSEKSLSQRWQQIPNLKYLDYLSRNSVVLFYYDKIQKLLEELKEAQQNLLQKSLPDEQKKILENMDHTWREINSKIDIIKEIGADSSSILYNLGVEIFHAHKTFDIITELLLDEALDLWFRALESGPYTWNIYLMITLGCLKKALLDPENADYILKEIDDVIVKMIQNMKHWKSMRKNIKNAEPYKQMHDLIQFRKNFMNFSGPVFLQEKQRAIALIEGPADQIKFSDLQSFLHKSLQQLIILFDTSFHKEFMQLWKTLWNKKKKDLEFLFWHVQTLREFAQNSDILDKNFYVKTAEDCLDILKKPETREELQMLISLIYISNVAQREDLKKIYKYRLLNNTVTVSEAEAIQLKQLLEKL